MGEHFAQGPTHADLSVEIILEHVTRGEIEPAQRFGRSSLGAQRVGEERRDAREVPPVPHALERLGGGTEGALSRYGITGYELDTSGGTQYRGGEQHFEAELLGQHSGFGDQVARDREVASHRLEPSARRENCHFRAATSPRPEANVLGHSQARIDVSRAVQRSSELAAEALCFLPDIADLVGVGGGTLEIVDVPDRLRLAKVETFR